MIEINDNKKIPVPYIKPSREEIIRSVATSTAIDTGQPSHEIEASLEAKRKEFVHLRLAV